MSKYNLEFNKDDSVIRYIIVSLLSELNDKIKYSQISDQEKKYLGVPFYYSVTGNERFLIDNFLNDETADPTNEHAIGTYNTVPRGVINLTSMDIDAGSLVNKFVRMERLEKEDKNLVPYSYETMIIPIELTFETKIICNSNIEMLKITESAMRSFYKNRCFYVDLGGYRIAASVSIPESLDNEQLFDFSYSDKITYNISFSLSVKSFLPIFEESTKIFAGNNMTGGLQHNMGDMSIVPEEDQLSNQGHVIIDNTEGLLPTGPDYGVRVTNYDSAIDGDGNFRETATPSDDIPNS